MKIRNTIKLILSNMKTVFADLLFRSVITALLVVISALFVMPLIEQIIANSATTTLTSAFRELIVAFFEGGQALVERRGMLSSAWLDFVSMLTGYVSEITWVSFGLIIIFVAYAFFNGMANYASGVAIDDYMSSLARTGYFKAILRRFSKGFLYQLIFAVIDIVWSSLVVLLCAGFFTLTIDKIGVVALSGSVIIFILGRSVFSSFFSNFLPSVVTSKNGIKRALKESISLGLKHFSSLFLQYVLYSLLAIYVNVSFAIFTFGAGLVFTIPASCVYSSCIKLVNYYSATGKKYYIDYENIVTPRDAQKEEEKFLDDIYL